MSKNLYVVLYDFTSASEKALKYALFLAKHVSVEIRLIHFASDKHKAEKPINEIIYNLFSTDCFFLILFLLKQAYNFHHVLRKPSMR